MPRPIKLLIDRGADIEARSNPAAAPRRGAPGKSGDPGGATGTAEWVPAGEAHAADSRRCTASAPRRQPRSAGAAGQRQPGQPAAPRDASARRSRPAGSERRRADRAGVRDAGQFSRVRQGAAGRRRRRQSDHRLRLDPAARGDAKPVLPARLVPDRQGRGREQDEQGRLDAPLSRRGQPQHRRRRLSGPQGRHGPPGLHQEAARQGRRRERPDDRQHRGPHGLHEPVAGRERRDGVSARVTVERSRGDAAAAGARRRSEDRDRSAT